ncbi:MAG TPA: VanW family protein [Patescibacteria group bacterium]|nr:VanW family protein [Patescibacteria group bacterium]
MDHNLLNGKTHLSNFSSGGFWMVKVLLLASLVGIAIFCTGVYVWAQEYEGRLPPRTHIDGLAVGGMDPEDVQRALQERIDAILTDGIEVVVDGQKRTLSLVTISSSDLSEDVDFALGDTIDRLMKTHQDASAADALAMFLSLISHRAVTVPVTLQEDRIQTNVLALFPDAEILSQNATFKISWNTEKDMWSIGVVEGSVGREFQWESFFTTLGQNLTKLDPQLIELSLIDKVPKEFSEEEAHELVSKAATALQTAPYEIIYEDQTWELTGEELATMLAPGDDLRLTLLDQPLAVWVSSITQEVNQIARDARLNVENGRVVDFVESLEGRALNENQLKEDLLAMMAVVQEEPLGPIELVVDVTQPVTTTSDVNDLGIDEILGVGTSSYRGSPTNRRGNIQNGVDLLNGILIAPGETFSLLAALSPFTYENGYLPELVIKGDKIIPEIGGGLCQIGTTTFRAAMNSGLPIVARQNHSLVVSYYNDPSNGNPGTDATIYEPAPDFKFLNDTEHYILFQAENLTDSQELQFTFWGTNDGREASYSPPVVSRWIPVGETVYTETLDLEPSVEQCQGSHIGADASFVYTVVSAEGETFETLFESHYRPLPRICLVGVEELTEESPETEEEESLSTEILAPDTTAP